MQIRLPGPGSRVLERRAAPKGRSHVQLTEFSGRQRPRPSGGCCGNLWLGIAIIANAVPQGNERRKGSVTGGNHLTPCKGHLHLPETPGLGVHPDEEALGSPVARYAL